MVDKWLKGKEIVSVTYRIVLTREIIDMIDKADQAIKDQEDYSLDDLLYSKLDKIDGVYDSDYLNMVVGAEESIWVTVDGKHCYEETTWREIERVINEHIGTTPG